MNLNATVLRCMAESFYTRPDNDDENEFFRGWNAAMIYAGDALSDYLDNCDVAQLDAVIKEIEDEKDALQTALTAIEKAFHSRQHVDDQMQDIQNILIDLDDKE